MSNQEKKDTKRKSIELIESIKVEEWEKNQVFNPSTLWYYMTE